MPYYITSFSKMRQNQLISYKYDAVPSKGLRAAFSYIPTRKEGGSPTGQPSGWLFSFHNEEDFQVADDKKNIPEAGKVDEPHKPGKVEAPKDQDAPAPPKEGAPQPGKDEKQTTIPGMRDHFSAGKAADFTIVGDRSAEGR